MIALDNADALSSILTERAEMALDLAKKSGASSAAVSLDSAKGLSVEVRQQSIEKLKHYLDQSLSITVYHGHRKGNANSADLSPEAIKNVVDAATNIAKHTEEDIFNGLADEHRMAVDPVDLDQYHPWNFEIKDAIDTAKRCEQAAYDHDDAIENGDGAGVDSFVGFALMANSHGFCQGHMSSIHSIGCTVMAKADDKMQRDHWYTQSRVPSKLEAADSIGEKAAERAVARLNVKPMKTGEMAVLFSADVARSLIGHLLSAISGSALYHKATFMLDSKGKQYFPDFVRIHEQPHIPQALGSRAYDAEGVATIDRDIINNGIVQDYLLGSYSARKLGLESTASAGGVSNLMVEPSHGDLNSMLNKLGTGIIVTELIGSSVNTITGDYSRGASGYWVENGVIQHAVEEITVAGNLKDMFANIIAIGADIDPRSSTRCGSILVHGMTVAGQ